MEFYCSQLPRLKRHRLINLNLERRHSSHAEFLSFFFLFFFFFLGGGGGGGGGGGCEIFVPHTVERQWLEH